MARMGHDHERAELSRLRRRQVHAVDRQIATSLDERRKQHRIGGQQAQAQAR
jgi:hypothetical protein